MHIGLTVSAYVGVRKGCPMTYSINTATTPGWLEMTTPVSDEAAHQDGRLMHELAVVNSQIGRYILRFLDVDAGHAESISTDAERALANRMAELAAVLRGRADRRRGLDGQPITVEGDVKSSQITQCDTPAEQP